MLFDLPSGLHTAVDLQLGRFVKGGVFRRYFTMVYIVVDEVEDGEK